MRKRSQAYDELWGIALPETRGKLRLVYSVKNHTTSLIQDILDMLNVARQQQESEINDVSFFLNNIDAILDYLSRTGKVVDRWSMHEHLARRFWINKKYIPCHILFRQLASRYEKTHEFFQTAFKRIRQSVWRGESIEQSICDIWEASERRRWYPEITTFDNYKSMLEYYSLRYFWKSLSLFLNQE